MNRPFIVSIILGASLATFARGDAELASREIEGTWKPRSAEFAGDAWPQKILETMKLVLKGDTYLVDVGGLLDEGTCKRDHAKSPKTLDITGTKGPNEGKTFLAIYELKGDELKVCYDLSGKSRPTEFATKPDTQLFLVTYHRVKP